MAVSICPLEAIDRRFESQWSSVERSCPATASRPSRSPERQPTDAAAREAAVEIAVDVDDARHADVRLQTLEQQLALLEDLVAATEGDLDVVPGAIRERSVARHQGAVAGLEPSERMDQVADVAGSENAADDPPLSA